jgi:TonB family protein
MRKLLGRIAIAAALALAAGIPARAEFATAGGSDDILIRWDLFEGSKSKDAQVPSIVLSSAPMVPSAVQLSDAAKIPVRNLAMIQNELASIYHLESVQSLISNGWAWSRKNEKVINSLLLEETLLPITFTSVKRSGKQVNIRVQVSQVSTQSSSAVEMGISSLVDMELLTRYNESTVVGFELRGRSYFLVFEILKGDAPSRDPGFDSDFDEVTFLPASRPVVCPPPVYPPACKAAGIGGMVVLRIDADASGAVTRTVVLRGAHPDLDRAAREAVLGWKYSPVLKDGRPVPVSFALSISFNPNRPSFQAESPTMEEPEPPAASAENLDPKLVDILDKAAAYCDKLKRASLDFVCREEVDEWSMPSESLFKLQKHLVYDYQLVKKKDETTERRILIEENGVKKEEKNAPLKTERFYSSKAVFGPIGFLAKEWHSLYSYKLLREERIRGRKAYVIEARPRTAIANKPNFGKLWVDQIDFGVLRIEVEQESLLGFESAVDRARRDRFKPIFTIRHDYDVVKNGLRFPSRSLFEETYQKRGEGSLNYRITMSKTDILYRDYRYFTVSVDVAFESPDKRIGRKA